MIKLITIFYMLSLLNLKAEFNLVSSDLKREATKDEQLYIEQLVKVIKDKVNKSQVFDLETKTSPDFFIEEEKGLRIGCFLERGNGIRFQITLNNEKKIIISNDAYLVNNFFKVFKNFIKEYEIKGLEDSDAMYMEHKVENLINMKKKKPIRQKVLKTYGLPKVSIKKGGEIIDTYVKGPDSSVWGTFTIKFIYDERLKFKDYSISYIRGKE